MSRTQHNILMIVSGIAGWITGMLIGAIFVKVFLL